MIVLFGFLGLFCVSLFFLLKCQSKQKRKCNETKIYYKIIELLIGEQTRGMYVPTVTTITFYEGSIASDLIIGKWRSILRVNPWLCGRIISRKIDGKSSTVIKYPACFEENSLSRHVVELHIDNSYVSPSEKFDENASMDIILSKVQDHFVKKGTFCVDKDEVLAKVLIVKIFDLVRLADNGVEKRVVKTAFILSISHVLGDGNTFYTIYSMFDRERSASELLPERMKDFQSKITNITGSATQEYIRSYLVIIAGLLRLTCFPQKYQILQFRVNPEQIQKVKEKWGESNQSNSNFPFISTNDIIASWFYKACSCEYGMMPLNFRNRFPEYTNQHAGNYMASVLFHPETYSNPYLVREIVSSSATDVKLFMKVPTTLETVKFSLSIFSNWSTFYEDIIFSDDNRLLFHSPLLSTQGMAIPNALIAFRPRAGELALYVICDEKKKARDWLDTAEFLEPISYDT